MRPRVLRAIQLFERGDVIAAEAELYSAIVEGDDSAALHAMLGLCLLGNELPDRARKEVNLALCLEPNLPFAHYALSYVQQAALRFVRIPFLGTIPLDGAQARLCLQSIKKAVELAPEDGRYLIRLAELHQLLGQWRQSLAPAEQAVALDPANVPATVMCAEALFQLGRGSRARQMLAQVLELNPETSRAHAGMGWALLRTGEHERAAQFFDEALRINADLSWAQAGALECAKHRYRSYRMVFWFRNRLSNRPVVPRLLLIVAMLALLFFGVTTLFEWLDKFVRPRLGNEGAALLLSPVLFAVIGVVFFYETFFTWLVRHRVASKTSVGQDCQQSARHQFANILWAVLAGFGFFLLKHHAAEWLGLLLGILPGSLCFWETVRQKTSGFKRGLWGAYSGFILLLGLIASHFYAAAISHWDRVWLVLMLCSPLVPIGIAVEYHQRCERANRHDARLESLLHKSRTDK